MPCSFEIGLIYERGGCGESTYLKKKTQFKGGDQECYFGAFEHTGKELCKFDVLRAPDVFH